MWKNGPLERPDPLPKKGDASIDATFSAVGQALTQWELADERFAIIFLQLLESNSSSAVRAYTSIATPSGRQDLLRGASEVFFDEHRLPGLQQELNGLLKCHQKAAARRNDIAHGIVFGTNELGYLLIPPMLSRKRDIYLNSAYRYSSIEILHYAKQFQLLHDDAHRFRMALDAALGRPE